MSYNKKKYYVYFVRCKDNSLYIGMTSNLEQRICDHNDGIYPNSYTRNKRPVTLVYSGEFDDVFEAIASERKMKRWSRKKKEAFLSGKWNQLKLYSNCQNDSHARNVNRRKYVLDLMAKISNDAGAISRLRSR